MRLLCRRTKVCRFALLVISIFMLGPAHLLSGQTRSGACVVPEHYNIVALPLQPARISDRGQVAGTTQNHRAALWSEQSGLRELPMPAGFYNSEGIALNKSGQIAGVVSDRNLSKHQGFIFRNRALTLLPGEQSRPRDISDSGEVVGEAMLAEKKDTSAVLWKANKIQPLGGCCGGSAKRINKHGIVVGDVYDEAGRYHAFQWSEKQGMQAIGPADRYSSAIAVNNQGHVLIQSASEVSIYASGSLYDLELSSESPSHPLAMNDCEMVVGSYGPFSDADRAFSWDKKSGFRDLNNLIPSESGWKLESAASINNRGEIVGRGDYKDQEDTGFLLIPIH